MEILPIEELSPYEKDECKILISDYLNNSDGGKILQAKNVNQLNYIIDFLIEYINNKERIFKEKMGMSFIKKNKTQENEEDGEVADGIYEINKSIHEQLNEVYGKDDNETQKFQNNKMYEMYEKNEKNRKNRKKDEIISNNNNLNVFVKTKVQANDTTSSLRESNNRSAFNK